MKKLLIIVLLGISIPTFGQQTKEMFLPFLWRKITRSKIVSLIIFLFSAIDHSAWFLKYVFTPYAQPQYKLFGASWPLPIPSGTFVIPWYLYKVMDATTAKGAQMDKNILLVLAYFDKAIAFTFIIPDHQTILFIHVIHLETILTRTQYAC